MPKFSSIALRALFRRRRRRRRPLADRAASPPLPPSSSSQVTDDSRDTPLHDDSIEAAQAMDESSSHHIAHGDETLSLASFKVAERHASRECAICLEALADNVVSSGQCLHLLHQTCLNAWLASSPRALCPVCRHPLLAREARSQRLCSAAATLAVLRDGRAWWWPEPWLSAEEARFERALHALWRVDAASLGPLPMVSTSPPLLREWMLAQIAHEWLNESAGHEWLQYEYMLEGVAV
ncbi:putative E3 ubiquitin-protein ligase RHA1A [Gracilariopsis chorda]|uniref:Putative E3 ubiquitin-protein ligase RHA1A n=1 Tax=Gracilariopsis chorda TaxID=448386 RepID=A0A2V3J043_9FLOR|nr:putative E3 ubiquitin-protein ligase RHA1A [Gracilariopsis chorda]|eukprot:PXF47782.1 putative E3 ubiquitin-protein ligase RHA1A [Gracilariopsis chorda]